jgi:hypothetical protein
MPEKNLMPEGNTMNDAEIDPVLSGQDEILPSAGFVACVMDAVRREAAVPPPIPFPWKRALPGLALALVVMALVAVGGVFAVTHGLGGSTAPQVSATTSWSATQGMQGKLNSAAAWTAIALLLTLITMKFSMRLAAGRT